MDNNELIKKLLPTLSNTELLSIHSDILLELRSRNVLRTKNNPVGDYAEWLVSQAFKMKLLNNSNPGVDAIDSDGQKVQIKARRVTADNSSKQLSALRNYDAHEFDYLIAVIFDEKYNVIEAYQIPHAVIGNYARFSKHTNAHLIRLKGPILLDERIVDIKEKMILNIKKSHNKLSLSS
ncbi:DUF6998 domain-containing protein [Providencia rettgeri]|uniref:DUF6998 domain-containing protein n=1 Tax=Providencia rettgeri TaxID=587 RepID=UPI001B38AB86|nr:hypothetical protein [Providencia rettgeri]MBQ0367871.1 hypothetical protein [Providencia rettgeri]